jgi:hypothetical protein
MRGVPPDEPAKSTKLAGAFEAKIAVTSRTKTTPKARRSSFRVSLLT